MYKITGADGKEYGPASVQQIQEWIAQGRVNAQTRVQQVGAVEWKPASEYTELAAFFTAPVSSASSASPPFVPVGQKKQGLAITSFVLGVLSLVCFGLLASNPAIICGHIAHSRARRAPGEYGGSGLAVAGFVMGYVSFVTTMLLAAMLLPALARAKARAQSISCVGNMKQIGLSFRTWALDHNAQFPFNVSTNAGGTRELCSMSSDGFEQNPSV